MIVEIHLIEVRLGIRVLSEDKYSTAIGNYMKSSIMVTNLVII